MAFNAQYDDRIVLSGKGLEDAYYDLYASKMVTLEDSQTITGAKTFAETCTFNKDINGTALKAYWADLAECYQLDQQYPPGTCLQFGGQKELTIATDTVNAVVSAQPGFVLNNGNGTPVCLSGRVPVRVIGEVQKFDKLKLYKDGVAIVDNNAINCFARALETNKDSKEKLVLCSCIMQL